MDPLLEYGCPWRKEQTWTLVRKVTSIRVRVRELGAKKNELTFMQGASELSSNCSFPLACSVFEHFLC